MDNGLWDALHRLTLKVDRLITDKGEKRGREPTEDKIVETWKTFYNMGFREKRRIWTFSCGHVDNIGEYRRMQDDSRARGNIGYVREDESKNGKCIWFYAYADETTKDLIVIEHRIRSEVKKDSELNVEFTDLIRVEGTPQQAFNWLQGNLGPYGYTGSPYAPIK
jgi:hypothetical protein